MSNERQPWMPQGIPMHPDEDEDEDVVEETEVGEELEGAGAETRDSEKELEAEAEAVAEDKPISPRIRRSWESDRDYSDRMKELDQAILDKRAAVAPAKKSEPSPSTTPGGWYPGKRGRPPKNRGIEHPTAPIAAKPKPPQQPQQPQRFQQPAQVRAPVVVEEDDEDEKVEEQPKMSKNKGSGKYVTHQGIPHDRIKELIATGFPQVNLVVRRRAPNGRFEAVVAGHIIDTVDLLDIEAKIAGLSGGGVYEVESRDPADLGNFIIPRFVVQVAGVAKPSPHMVANATGMPPAGLGGLGVSSFAPAGSFGGWGAQAPTPPAMYDPNGRMQPPPDLPNVYRSYPIEQQWHLWQQLNPGKLPQGASMHSDQVAMYAEQNAQREKQALMAENARLGSKVDQLLERINKSEIAAEKARHQGEMEALRAEVRAMQHKDVSPQGIAQLAALAPFVPVFVEWVKSRSTTDTNAMQAQNKQMELLVSRLDSNKKPDTQTIEMLKVLAPIAAPILISMVENRSPSAVATANIESLKAQTAMMEFMGDFVKKHADSQEQEPWWLPIVHSTFESLKDMIAQRALSGGGAPAGLPSGQPQQSTAIQQAKPVQQPARRSAPQVLAVDPNNPAHWAALAKQNPQAAEMTRMVFANLSPDLGFHTHEWKVLLYNLHIKLDPGEFAQFLADHLDHLATFGMLPPVLVEIGARPLEILAQVIGSMPIAKVDPQYAQAVVEKSAAEILQRLREREKVAAEDAEDAQEAVAVAAVAAVKTNGHSQADVEDGVVIYGQEEGKHGTQSSGVPLRMGNTGPGEDEAEGEEEAEEAIDEGAADPDEEGLDYEGEEPEDEGEDPPEANA